jgi:OmpA-OmpF porin, OOP family
MKTSFTKKQLTLAVACAMAMGFGFASGAARAQVAGQAIAPAAERALVITTVSQVWKNGFGECWHSGFGPAPVSTAECDPNYRPIAQYVAPAPAPYVAPAPVVVAAAAPEPVYEKVTFDADALFDFDKAVLRPEGRAALDSFISSIRGVTPATITAVGHTDRLGSDSYNQTLSEERAAAVKAYLVGQGIDASSVQTAGKGEMQPVTKAGDCKGGKSSNLIACLQPDRRVEVEVSGSRIKQ